MTRQTICDGCSKIIDGVPITMKFDGGSHPHVIYGAEDLHACSPKCAIKAADTFFHELEATEE